QSTLSRTLSPVSEKDVTAAGLSVVKMVDPPETQVADSAANWAGTLSETVIVLSESAEVGRQTKLSDPLAPVVPDCVAVVEVTGSTTFGSYHLYANCGAGGWSTTRPLKPQPGLATHESRAASSVSFRTVTVTLQRLEAMSWSASSSSEKSVT